MRHLAPALAAGLCLAVQPALAAERPAHASMQATANLDEPGKGDPAKKEDAGKIDKADIASAPISEQAVTTRHTLNIDGRAIPYRATAGTLTIRDDEGKPTASVFYVAYVADPGKGQARRPVTFFYNGGPGSPSMWLHMGSFAPVRVRTTSPDPNPAAPYVLGPNDQSLLGKTDMVFIDAIGAGYSRPIGEAKGKDFWGVDQDIDGFAKAITRYVSINDRWNSPKFLFGESYGTTRSAGLVYKLQDEGMQFNGVVLLSSILNYGMRNPGFDHMYQVYLPSYAATAWYHDRIPNKPADLEAFLAEVRAYADGPYVAALAKGDRISPAEMDAVASKLSQYTGLSPQFIKDVDLRIDLGRFRKELERGQRRTVGRLDSRFEGIDVDAGGDSPSYDASDAYITGAFIGAFHDYLTTQLGYRTNLDYRPSNSDINRSWDWKHKAPGAQRPQPVADTALDLAQAMRENPRLKVYSLNGYYDMATPFFGTEYDIAHMQLDPALRRNVEFAYYPSGHMVYLHEDSLKRMRADLDRWYDSVR
jgi:carboxypeptidase C (cathepsin A)